MKYVKIQWSGQYKKEARKFFNLRRNDTILLEVSFATVLQLPPCNVIAPRENAMQM